MARLFRANFSVRGNDNVIRRVDRIEINIPRYVRDKGKNLLNNVGVPAAKKRLAETNVGYTGALERGFVVSKYIHGDLHSYTLRNIEPYARAIDSGVPIKKEWESSLAELNKWRIARIGIVSQKEVVKVGYSGGGDRFEGYPYPKGVEFMKAASAAVLRVLHSNVVEALRRGMI